MANHTTARNIRNHVASLQTMTRFVLATLALASGVYTYLGVRSLLDGDATFVFFAAIIYSVAVSVGIYGFWTYLARLLPEMRDAGSRISLFLVMCVGSLMIIAMSSWLNAAALAGSAAVEQHLATTQEGYTADLDQANSNAIAALSLLPDIQRAGERFARLADEERQSGALTGTSGSGTVVQLLSQMSAQMRELEANILASRGRVQELFEEGQQHLATMRGLVSGAGPVQPRSDSFAEESVQLAGVIAALQQTSIAPSVARAAQDLSTGFIAPVAGGLSPDLAGRQTEVMSSIRASVDAQSQALSTAAAEILAQPRVEERRFVPLSSAEAVILYASSFLPSWAGAISIDLLPGVLVAMLAVAHAAQRRDEEGLTDADRVTAADMMRAIELHEAMERARGERFHEPQPDEADMPEPVEEEPAAAPRPPSAQPTSSENVTPLSVNERKRFDP
ncbi:hypothetical protein [Aliihoeflea sp. PC F10.4]